MKGSVDHQVRMLSQSVNAIGSSKHSAKETARSQGARTWHEIGTQIGIHSYKTMDKYTQVWRDMGNFLRSEFKLYDMQRMNAGHVQAYLEGKIADGVKYSSLTTYAAAAQKLEQALNLTGERFGNYQNGHYSFSDTIKDVRTEAREILDRTTETRAYYQPGDMIKNIADPLYRLAAQIQLESGARISEMSSIKEHQLNSTTNSVSIRGKGGKPRELQLSLSTFTQLQHAIHTDKWNISHTFYGAALRIAAEKSGQKPTGSHGLRWNFASNRMAALTSSGQSRADALIQVSHEMGHERGSITEHYLRQ